MSKIVRNKRNFALKARKKLKSGGYKSTLVSDDKQNEIVYVESSGRLYFVGITEPPIVLGNKNAMTIVKQKHKA